VQRQAIRKEYKDITRTCWREVCLKQLMREAKGKKERNGLDSHDSLDFYILETFTPQRAVASQFIVSALHQ